MNQIIEVLFQTVDLGRIRKLDFCKCLYQIFKVLSQTVDLSRIRKLDVNEC